LRDRAVLEAIDSPGTHAEVAALLRAEGPKYQYGQGCLSDGVIGAWMGRVCDVSSSLNEGHVRRALESIYRHNFRADLSEHACLQRPGYANGHEAGLLLCTWPRGGEPTLPFPYSDEVWTGIEYQVASHMIHVGLVDEAMTIVRGVRARHEGHVRNPFNEYECGNYYARAMSSYALLTALSGFRYSAVERTLRLAPRSSTKPFRTFFSTATGFGVVSLDSGNKLQIRMIEGRLSVRRVVVESGGATHDIPVDVIATDAQVVEIALK
jgi:hypothetical protein